MQPLSAKRAAGLVAIVLAGACGASGAQATTYSLTDLGTLGGYYSQAQDINGSGQVAGSSSRSDSIGTHATQWDTANNTKTDLGPVGGFDASEAYGINAFGQVVGDSYNTDASNGKTQHATLWDSADNIGTDLGTLGGTTSEARGINGSEQIVGWSDTTGDAAQHATLWDNNYAHYAHDLGTLGGTTSMAYGINGSGQVAGWSDTSNDAAAHATLWDTRYNSSLDLGTIGGNYSKAFGINDSGQVVGWTTINDIIIDGMGTVHAVVWDTVNYTRTDLGTLGGTVSLAYGINGSGQVVGVSDTSNDAAAHATLWEDGSIIDLNSVLDSSDGWTLVWAYAINDSGQIVGYGTDGAGDTHAFLLTPDAVVGSTPLPASLPLFASGLGGLGLLRWRRRKAAKAAA